MVLTDKEVYEKRIEKMKEEIQSLKDRISVLKGENIHLNRELKEKNTLLSSLPSGMILIQKGKIKEVGGLLLDELGYDKEDLIGRNLSDFISHDQKKTIRDINKTLRSGEKTIDQFEVRLVTRHGEMPLYGVYVNRIRLKNRTAFLLNLFRIEKRIELEKKKLLSEKKEATSRMASRVAGYLDSYYHDLMDRIGNLKTNRPLSGDDIPCLTNEIETETGKISSIIADLEMLSGVEGKSRDMIYFDINDSVKWAVSSMGEGLINNNSHPDTSPDLKLYLRSCSTILGDPKEIQDAVINIVKNAFEASQKESEVLITTEDSSGYSHVYIQDHGTGIPEEIQDKVFDPFFTTKGRNSLGLGLSRSRAIIEKHKGEIGLISDKNQGSIFHIKLPASQKAPRQ